ncbi:MAG: hypothetical protein L0G87_09745 [Renibacterium salmoninarum]|nr:hypothetical protein [Renibacterium salmoninarum]
MLPKSAIFGGVLVAIFSFLGTNSAYSAEPERYFSVDYANRAAVYTFFEVSYDSPSRGHGSFRSGVLAVGMDRRTTVPSDAYNIVIEVDQGDILMEPFKLARWDFRELDSDVCVSSWGSIFSSGATLRKGAC